MSVIRFKKYDLSDLKKIRNARGENQQVFWSRLGVTQSGGSRYESGRSMPTSVAALLLLFLNDAIDEEMLGKAVKAAKG